MSVDIQILQVNENKFGVKFTYKNPASKHDLVIDPTIYAHFESIRDSEPLKMFFDTTFEEASE